MGLLLEINSSRQTRKKLKTKGHYFNPFIYFDMGPQTPVVESHLNSHVRFRIKNRKSEKRCIACVGLKNLFASQKRKRKKKWLGT